MIQDNFEFHVPITIVKAGEQAEKMVLGGIASTADTDREGESLIPEGFDYSYLLNHGYINWHHQMNKNPEAIIGEPTLAKIVKGKGLYIEGELYKDSDMAKKAYNLAKVLDSSSKKRKMGWSIEGKVVSRDPNNPKRVLKARITGVALTPMPINPNTLVNIVKGMSDDKVLEDTEEFSTKDDATIKENGGATNEITIGNQTVSIKKGEDDDLLITVKGMNTQNAAAVMPESLEGSTKPKSGQGFPPEKRDNDKKGKMSKSETYEYLFANYPTMTIKKAKEVVGRIYANKK